MLEKEQKKAQSMIFQMQQLEAALQDESAKHVGKNLRKYLQLKEKYHKLLH